MTAAAPAGSSTPGRRLRLRRCAAAPAVTAGLALSLSGCASASPTAGVTASRGPATSAATVPSAGTARGAVGPLQLDGAYIPQQASPDVAAAYLRVTNTGGSDDVLDRVSTPAAATVMLHDTVGDGGVERMVPLEALTVPAHRSMAFRVGQRHLMLMNPKVMLRQGQVVPLTVHFAKAGSVTLLVPVVGFGGPPDVARDGAAAPSMLPSGPAMPGMAQDAGHG